MTPLAPGTIEAIRGLLVPGDAPEATEDRLRRWALGVESPDGKTLLGSPSARTRLAELRRLAHTAFEESLPKGERVETLACLAVFASTFDEEDVRAVFPTLGPVPSFLSEEGRLVVSPAMRRVLPAPEDPGWPSRYVDRLLTVLGRIDARLAEGLWSDGRAMLRERLPDLRAAWRLAGELGRHDAVERFVRRLSAPLLEMALDEFPDLMAEGYRTAEATGDRELRSYVLSLDGASAALRDDRERADRLWKERLALTRELGNHAAEADVLLDLAGQSFEEGDWPTFDRYLTQALKAAETSGRADLTANCWAKLARRHLEEGDPVQAHALAERAMATLTGLGGANLGLYVRFTLARTFRAQGRRGEATHVLADVLERALEAGRAANCATILDELGELTEWSGNPSLAERCLAVSAAINRVIGTRRARSSTQRLAAFHDRHPAVPSSERATDGTEAGWGPAVQGILERLWTWLPSEVAV